MSNKLEAALGGEPANTFTDSYGDEYRVFESGRFLSLVLNGVDEVAFFKADATKIIALIAEAAK